MAQPDETAPETVTEQVAEAAAEAAPSTAKAALTLIAANLAMKAGTRLVENAVGRTILRDQRVKSSRIAATAAKIATRSKPGALLVGAGLLAKTLFDHGGKRRARLANDTAGKAAKKRR